MERVEFVIRSVLLQMLLLHFAAVSLEKRTSAAKAVSSRAFTARLKPCPSSRDVFSFGVFKMLYSKLQFVQNPPLQRLKRLRKNSAMGRETYLRG
jgi:hypothetical protein